MSNFWYSLLAHFILDYPFQGDFIAMTKGKNNFILLTHCLFWGLGISAVMDHFHIYQSWMLAWLFLGHLAMDYIKSRGILGGWCGDVYQRVVGHGHPVWVTDQLSLPLWIDQAWHIGQILVCLRFASL